MTFSLATITRRLGVDARDERLSEATPSFDGYARA
jgi:hypothetical protein